MIEITSNYNIKLIVGQNTSDYKRLTKKYRFPYIFCDISLDYAEEGFDIVKIHKKRKTKSKIIAFTSGDFSSDFIENEGFDYLINKKASNLIKFVETIALRH